MHCEKKSLNMKELNKSLDYNTSRVLFKCTNIYGFGFKFSLYVVNMLL